MDPADKLLPPHIESTIAAISELHAEHHRQARPQQKAINGVIAALSRPASLFLLLLFVIAWIGANALLAAHGHTPLDPPPFAYLSVTASVVALCVAAMILATQRHNDELATRRDQLTLELAILSDQRSAKIIGLLDDLRQSCTQTSSGRDLEAEAMAVPADPKIVLEQIRAAEQGR